MTNVTRLAKHAGIDYCTAQERLIFTRRRKSLKWPLTIALVILTLFSLHALADCRDWGSTKHGLAFVIDQCGPYPLLEFTIYITTERG